MLDDIIITGNSSVAIDVFVKQFKKSFSLKGLGSLKFFLGIKVSRSSNGIHFCRLKYIREMIAETNLHDNKHSDIPMATGMLLSKHDGIALTDHLIVVLQVFCNI